MLVINVKWLIYSNRAIGIISLESFFQVLSLTLCVDFKIQCRINIFLLQGLSKPEFYCDLVYTFKKIMGRTDFADQF